MFYVAYVKDGTAGGWRRPAGDLLLSTADPGSSSLWLEMGSFGPMRVEATDAAPTPPPPYRVVENPESLLDVTDLVYIDAMGTGYSRILPKGKARTSTAPTADIAAFGQFILRWVTQNQRWNAPKFLLGESYGTTRAAGLLAYLAGKGMAFNGSGDGVVVPQRLGRLQRPPFSNDRAVRALPADHGGDRLVPRTPRQFPKSAPAALEAAARRGARFALGEYAQALAKGGRLTEARAREVIAKLRRYTGMSEDLLRQANLRIDPSRFQKELLRDERRTWGASTRASRASTTTPPARRPSPTPPPTPSRRPSSPPGTSTSRRSALPGQRPLQAEQLRGSRQGLGRPTSRRRLSAAPRCPTRRRTCGGRCRSIRD
jgi:hypothetical protein